MKLVTAIIKPFKLDEVREALSAIGVAGHHGDRSQGLWPAERPHRAVPRRGVRRRFSAQGQDRGGDIRRHARSGASRRSRKPRSTGKIGDGKIFVIRSRASRCASAPARPVRTPCKGDSDTMKRSCSAIDRLVSAPSAVRLGAAFAQDRPAAAGVPKQSQLHRRRRLPPRPPAASAPATPPRHPPPRRPQRLPPHRQRRPHRARRRREDQLAATPPGCLPRPRWC